MAVFQAEDGGGAGLLETLRELAPLEEKDLLTELMCDDACEDGSSTTGIQVYIGQETPVNAMKEAIT